MSANLQAALAELARLLGPRLSTSAAVREQHGTDESWHAPHAPDAVTFPESTEEVAAIVRTCAAHRVPIVPFGAGTSVEGHLLALQGGVSIDLSRMDAILRVNAEDFDVTVQPGVKRKQLNEYLRDTGLFFPIDPGADASLGGMASTRASGTNAVRYGTMRDNVLSMVVVLPDGSIVKTGTRARKSAAGYDLTRLFIGAEGTLGVITELTVRLYPQPEAVSSAVCPFADIAGAVQTVVETMQAGIPIARIELLDEVMIDACNRYSKLDLPVAPTLFLEFQGSPSGVAEQIDMVSAIAAGNGAGEFRWANRTEERNELWKARHNGAYAARALRANGRLWSTDVCVPISRLAECILETKRDLAESALVAPLLGHVGDGNFHLAIVIDPTRPEEIEEAARINERLVLRAIAMEGTCTGEHGVGVGKMKYLAAEHGDGALALMRTLKRAIDPDNLMNPGKIVRLDG